MLRFSMNSTTVAKVARARVRRASVMMTIGGVVKVGLEVATWTPHCKSCPVIATATKSAAFQRWKYVIEKHKMTFESS
jgi:hypothetical protein